MYLLMRDHLPTGAVCEVVQEITEQNFEVSEFQFTNSHLEALARDYAGRIKEGG